MPDQAHAPPRPLRAPPRIDVNAVSQPLQDLFSGWDIALAKPFVGLTADGTIEPGLFPLRKIGAGVQLIADAIAAFAASLDATQRKD